MTVTSLDRLSTTGVAKSAASAAEPHAGPVREQMAENLTLSEARDLLDWLEAHGIQARAVEADPAGRMTIRWAA